MPSRDHFPLFRDPNDTLMRDPSEFLVQLERQLKYCSVPLERYSTVLVACLPERLMQERVERDVVATCTSWDDMKLRFRQMYEDTNYKQDLMMQLDRCTQSMTERVGQYTERYQALLVRIHSGTVFDIGTNIVGCERGSIHPGDSCGTRQVLCSAYSHYREAV